MLADNALTQYPIGVVEQIIQMKNSPPNRVYKIECSKANYVLKINVLKHAEEEDQPSLCVFEDYYFTARALQNEMIYLSELGNHFAEIGLPRPIKNILGSYVTHLNGDEQAVLMTWIEGDNAANHRFTLDDAKKIGELLAMIHSMQTNVINHEIDYIDRLNFFLDRIRNGYAAGIFDARLMNIAEEAIDETKNRLSNCSERKALIHGDFYTYNLIASRGNFIPIDFGYCSIGYVYQDIASLCNEFDGDEKFKSTFIASYEAARNATVDPKYIKTFQAYLTIMYLAANSHVKGNYDWLPELY